jgi:hypothetical protein
LFVVPRVAVARHILKKLTGCEVAREDLPEGVRQKIATQRRHLSMHNK